MRNGSGRELDFLRADSWVRSKWPPCVNWDGPETLPESSIARTMAWSDTLEVLGMPNGMRVGQKVSRAPYMLAFDGQQPRFGEWDINYTFASEANAPGRDAEGHGGPAGQVAEPGAVAGQLPPDILADLYLRQGEQAARDGDPEGARAARERLQALRAEHGLEASPEDHYRHAQAWEAAGEPQRALEAAVRYLQVRGRDAERYSEALDLIGRAESGKPGAVAGEPFRPEPVCAGRRKEARAGWSWRAIPAATSGIPASTREKAQLGAPSAPTAWRAGRGP